MPDHTVGGPGLFSLPGWSYELWEDFLLGAHEDRNRLLSNLHDKNIYLIATPLFYNFYQEKAQEFLADAS